MSPYFPQPRSHKLVLLLLLLPLALPLDPSGTFTTQSTNCTLVFTSTSPFALQQCTRHTCMRNLADGHCSKTQQFVLEQPACYRECCGAMSFEQGHCQAYNELRSARMESADRRLLIVLGASLSGLLAATSVFAIVFLKCCNRNNNKNEAKVKVIPELAWKQCVFRSDKKCKYCQKAGAFVGLTCGDFYHLRCLSNTQQWNCPQCKKAIKKVKVFCPACLLRSAIIHAENFEQLDKKFVQAYEYHPGPCLAQLGGELDTDRKLTQSTKQ